MNNSDFLKRIGLTLIGQLLPDSSALSVSLKNARKGLLATVVAGMLLTAILLLCAFGLYHFLLIQGLSLGVALTLSCGLLVLLLVVSVLFAEKYISKLVDTKTQLAPKGLECDANIEHIASAFLNGLFQEDAQHATTPNRKNSTDEQLDSSKQNI